MITFDGKTALIIEDDLTSIRVLQQLLDYVAVASEVIADSRVAMTQLDDVPVPDVIFLDLEMPVTDGYVVLAHIRSNMRFADVPVVAYTTHISEINRAKQAGFHSFLGKPVDGRQFPKHLQKILAGVPVWEIPV